MAWTYRIRENLCRACRACVSACPNDAIVEVERDPVGLELHPSMLTTYAIDQERCDGCGACMGACSLRVIQRKFSIRKRA